MFTARSTSMHLSRKFILSSAHIFSVHIITVSFSNDQIKTINYSYFGIPKPLRINHRTNKMIFSTVGTSFRCIRRYSRIQKTQGSSKQIDQKDSRNLFDGGHKMELKQIKFGLEFPINRRRLLKSSALSYQLSHCSQ